MTLPHVALWSGPRNLSTALMYSFISRKDLHVFDEPLFGYFLKQTGVWRPSRIEALASIETDAAKVLNQVFKQKACFTKNIANHMEGLDLNFLLSLKNIILTRRPDEVLASYIKQVEAPTLLDLAYEHQLKIIDFLKANNQPFLVVEAKDLQNEPEKTLKALCNFVDIEFTKKMLHWEKGPKHEDGVWAKYWYKGVHQSTGFEAGPKVEKALPQNLQLLATECDVFYQKIIEYKPTFLG